MSRESIINSIAQVQQALDSVTMEIGREYARYNRNPSESLKEAINANVDVYHGLEQQMQNLKKELRKTP